MKLFYVLGPHARIEAADPPHPEKFMFSGCFQLDTWMSALKFRRVSSSGPATILPPSFIAAIYEAAAQYWYDLSDINDDR